MEIIGKVLVIAAVIFVAYLLAKIISAPLRLIFKLALNALLGFAILFLVNLFSSITGIRIETNLLSCLVAGIFGFPGVIAMVLLNSLL